MCAVTGANSLHVTVHEGIPDTTSVHVARQVCKAGVARMRKIWLTRHGESEYNKHALLGGDSNISPAGQIYARLLPDVIVDRIPLVRPNGTLYSSPQNPYLIGGRCMRACCPTSSWTASPWCDAETLNSRP